MSETSTDQWRKMASAPKDGTRILAVIRGTEQGPADVDVVRWTRHKRDADPCWVSTDSSADCAIVYEDWEVAFWMPLPTSIAPVRTPGLAAKLPEFPRDGQEIGGSGI
jgi:hypothetical protein